MYTVHAENPRNELKKYIEAQVIFVQENTLIFTCITMYVCCQVHKQCIYTCGMHLNISTSIYSGSPRSCWPEMTMTMAMMIVSE